jgi:hypothetical protein
MTASVKNIGPWKWIELLLFCITVFAWKSSTAQDSTTVTCLTEQELRAFHDIYDGRDECYAHFVEAVRVSRKWQDLYFDLKGKNRQLEKIKEQYRLDEADYEEFIALSVEELNTISKKLKKAEKKIQRKNMWLYIFGGIIAAETITIAAVFAVP